MFLRIASLVAIFGALLLPSQRNYAAPLEQETSPLADQTWARLGGPLGGMGYDIRMRPDNPDIMYVTDATAGVHMSTDGGQTWAPLNEGIDARTGPSGDAIPIFCLTIDPNNNDILWAGTLSMRGIYRSEDGGQTWEKRTNGIVEGSGLTIRGFAVELGNSNVVYAAGEVASWEWAGREIRGRATDLVRGVVYKSTDAGLHWQAVWRGDNLARYVWIDPADVQTLYVSTGIFDKEAANSDPNTGRAGGVGILKSTDGGETWAQINNGLGDLYIGSLFMHPNNPHILLVGAGNANYRGDTGIFLTTDGGAHWEKVQSSFQQITSVEFATSDPNVAYAAGDMDFFRSEDGGRSWEAFGGSDHAWGPKGVNIGIPIDFQVDPRDPSRIFVNAYGGGAFLSEDGGQTWASSSTGYTGSEIFDVAVYPNNSALVYINGKNGPFKSTDGGRTWHGINAPLPYSMAGGARIAVDPLAADHVVMSAGREGFIYESTDGAVSWILTANYRDEMWSLPTTDSLQKWQGLWAIAFAPSMPKKVYGGVALFNCLIDTREGLCDKPPIVSLLLSEDGGHTWVRQTGTELDGRSLSEIVVHPANPDKAWAATVGGGIFRTEDGGSTWEPSSEGLRAMMVMALALDPSNPDVLYAGTLTDGVFKSEDGGTTWRQSSYGMNPNEQITAIAVDPMRSPVVYAGSRSSGVFLSEDAGVSWHLINEGLRTRSVNSLSISSDGTVLYAGTKGEGVFRLSNLTQEQFNALAPTPTAFPPTFPPTTLPTQTSAPATATAAPTAQSTVPSGVTPTATPSPSGGGLPCPGGTVPLVLVGLLWLKRHSHHPSSVPEEARK